MNDPAFSPGGDVEEVPVPLDGPSLGDHEVERPVDLTDVVGEPERIPKGAADQSGNAPDHPLVDEPQPAKPERLAVRTATGGVRRHRRTLGAALLAAACMGAFAHGWHVGSERLRSAASEGSADVVNHITYQEEEGR